MDLQNRTAGAPLTQPYYYQCGMQLLLESLEEDRERLEAQIEHRVSEIALLFRKSKYVYQCGIRFEDHVKSEHGSIYWLECWTVAAWAQLVGSRRTEGTNS